MAEHGAKVTISSRKANACEAVAGGDQRQAHPGAAIAVPANISSKDDLQRLVDETRKAFGKVDILVCNAASNPYYGPMSGISDEAFRKILDNNIVSNNWLINMVAPEMKERKDGSIIIISSIGGLRGTGVIGAYAISKAADMQMARNLAQELSPVEHPGQLRRAGPGEDRLRPGALGHAGGRDAAPASARRCAGWASRTTSPARRSSWPARPAPGPPARPSWSTAARPAEAGAVSPARGRKIRALKAAEIQAQGFRDSEGSQAVIGAAASSRPRRWGRVLV